MVTLVYRPYNVSTSCPKTSTTNVPISLHHGFGSLFWGFYLVVLRGTPCMVLRDYYSDTWGTAWCWDFTQTSCMQSMCPNLLS